MGPREEARIVTRPTQDEIEEWHAFYLFFMRLHQGWHDAALEMTYLSKGDFVSADTIRTPPVAPVLNPRASTAPPAPERTFFFCTSCGRNKPWLLDRPAWAGAKCADCYADMIKRAHGGKV